LNHRRGARETYRLIFQRRFLDGLADGSITVALRRWRRPTVRSGGTLLTAAGEIAITSVSETSLDDITEADARRAGYASLAALRGELLERDEGAFYRIELGTRRSADCATRNGDAHGHRSTHTWLVHSIDTDGDELALGGATGRRDVASMRISGESRPMKRAFLPRNPAEIRAR
jgi:hypothetical protein